MYNKKTKWDKRQMRRSGAIRICGSVSRVIWKDNVCCYNISQKQSSTIRRKVNYARKQILPIYYFIKVVPANYTFIQINKRLWNCHSLCYKIINFAHWAGYRTEFDIIFLFLTHGSYFRHLANVVTALHCTANRSHSEFGY